MYSITEYGLKNKHRPNNLFNFLHTDPSLQVAGLQEYATTPGCWKGDIDFLTVFHKNLPVYSYNIDTCPIGMADSENIGIAVGITLL